MRSPTFVGTRQWERDVYDHISEHGRREGALLDEYHDLVTDDDTSPAFRFLAQMILEDEIRHHEMFDALAATMREMSNGEPDGDTVPSLSGLHADRHRIQRITSRLLELELEDERALKDLARRLKEFRKTTMWVLLAELMLDDTKKHIKMLRFIHDRSLDQPD